MIGREKHNCILTFNIALFDKKRQISKMKLKLKFELKLNLKSKFTNEK